MVRNRALPVINDISNYKPSSLSDHDKHLVKLAKLTSSFLRNNPKLLVTRADKGNVTVVMERQDYLTKMTNMLNDTDTYIFVNKDPTRKLISQLHDMLSRWKNKDYIPDSLYRHLNRTEGILPRAYGLPKIHKPGCPLRIIISSVDSPLYNLAKFLHNIIFKSVPRPDNSVKNSFQLVEKLRDLYIKDISH